MSEAVPIWECYRLLVSAKPDEWRSVLERCLEQVGSPYYYDIVDTALRVWERHGATIQVPDSRYICRNGYKLQRVAFNRSPTETLIGITLTRLVFEPGSTHPTYFSTDELFSKGKYPEVLRHQPMLAGIDRLIAFFNAVLVDKPLERHSDHTIEQHAHQVHYQFGDRSLTLTQVVQPPGLSRNLLSAVRSSAAAVPATVRLGVISTSVRNSNAALRIGTAVRDVLQDWRCSVSLTDLGNGNALEAFLADSASGQPIVLFPLEGKKGDRPPTDAIEWLQYLSAEHVAFQLYSTSANPLYSRHGLAIATLAKANGMLFVAEPIGFSNFRQSWFIGLDLGKGGTNQGKVVAITLSSPEGNLQAYWRASKDADETLSAEVLREGLSWIAAQAQSLSGDRHLYLIRDGRRPHHERLEFYQAALAGCDFTLIEYIKSGSPLIHRATAEPEPGTTILPQNSEFAALYPCTSPQFGVLTTPVKFCAPINPRQHSLSELSLLLTALCHSATLSYQPSRLPAPLQWANGLARLSYTDLQFSGWSHRPSKLVNFRTQA
ncbi:hypothetical protein H6F67_20740 [Microcoleus sp. FACHB-1515]|uniref:hypothetical protein n=1 Tax=Cyanophyceae TaxID=3028117 RepID=UPI001683424C|nr:hypothetical protein [Microcoleus sp. FACHB-1515]MBD2092280.1 hypothetical protein [Microcoleus sp. FACHB-1515]